MRQNRYRFQLLAPAGARGAIRSAAITSDGLRYERHLASMQRLRGRAYLQDGAIHCSHLDETGRHRMEGDKDSWHFLLIGPQEEVIGCLRMLVHPKNVSFDRLRVSHSALSDDPAWGSKLRQAIEADLRLTRRENLFYVELGGWAIAEKYRCTKAALETLLATYAWGQMMEGCVSSCTATFRNGSASILRRIGGTSLEADGEPLPPYMDPQYGCRMEILRFDSRLLHPRFEPLVNQMKQELSGSVIVQPAPKPSEEAWEEMAIQNSLLALGDALRTMTKPVKIAPSLPPVGQDSEFMPLKNQKRPL